MPPVAGMALPALLGIGASTAGSIFSAKAGAPKQVPTPPPTPLFPWLNNQFAQGAGAAGKAGFEGLTSMAKTGEPTDVGDSFTKMLSAQQKLLAQGRAGLREQFASSGALGSSNFATAAGDFEGQAQKDFLSQFAQMLQSSQENAAQRKLTASANVSDLFANAAMAYTPSSTLVSGAPSATGAGLGNLGQMLTLLSFLGKGK